MPQAPLPQSATLSPVEIASVIAANGKWFPDHATNKVQQQNFMRAIAIALAESGGRVAAVSSTGDYGLFQINKKAHPLLFKSGKWSDPADNVEMARRVYVDAGRSFKPWSTFSKAPYPYRSFQSEAVNAYIEMTVIPSVKKGGAIAGTSIIKWEWQPSSHMYRYYDDVGGFNDSRLSPAQVKASGGLLTDVGGTNGKAGDPGAAVAGILSPEDAAKLNAATNWTNPLNWIAPVLDFLKASGIVIGVFILAVLFVILGMWMLLNSTKTGRALVKSAPKAIPVPV